MYDSLCNHCHEHEIYVVETGLCLNCYQNNIKDNIQTSSDLEDDYYEGRLGI